MINAINVTAACVLIVWSIWCAMSQNVNDRVIGKAIYFVIAMSSFSIIRVPMNESALSMLLVCFALLGIRHYFLRTFKSLRSRWMAWL